jgi:ribonucleoside-diphosphate reductase alpha chain
MQFAGKPIILSNNRIYNCAAVIIDDYRAFSEIMFLLLGGSGCGFSCQKHHVAKLPPIKKPVKTRRFLVADSIEGWAEAIKVLVASYFINKALPLFDFSDIREKGARLVTSGGKAPGPQPLKECLEAIKKILDSKQDGEQLSTLNVHDIVCLIALSVMSGGIRRAALISLFSLDDEEMLNCKSGNWYETEPQRAMSNNSAVIIRHKVKKKDFLKVWKKVEESKCGEPGFYLSNNSEWLANPCVEISLRGSGQTCNLVEINISNVESQEDFNARCKAASFIATLQASYTNFHYLRDSWKKNTEKDALIGVSCTGIASGTYKTLNLEESVSVITKENKRVSDIIGINYAARQTCVKPSGTTSCVLGTSSGIHAWFDQYYLRRMKIGKNEAIYSYLKQNLPDLVEDDLSRPTQNAFIKIPIAAPEGAMIAPKESPIELLERIKYFSEHWIKPGHFKGDNSHNVSATVYIKDHEWEEVGEWMWKNRDNYNGLSVLPFDGGTYVQAPHESITKEQYEELAHKLKKIDLTQVIEVHDNTDRSGEIACGGTGTGCEVK